MKNNYKYDPPELLMIFLEWFCSQKYYEEVSGDLIEIFQSRANKKSPFLNRFFFFFDVVKFFRPFYWKKSLFINEGNLIMLSSYIKFAFRNFLKHSFNSAINVIGLTVGITCLLYICSYIYFEKSYDKQWEDYDRIYRLVTDASFMGKEMKTIESSQLVTKVLPDELPELEKITLMRTFSNFTVTYKENTIKEPNVLSTDSNFFSFFKTDFIFGSPENALKENQHIYIAKSVSYKLFGDTNPLGKSIKLDFNKEYLIKGVYEDFPLNSHFKPGIIKKNLKQEFHAWTNFNFVNYIKILPGTDPAEIQKKIDKITLKYLEKDFAKYGIDMEKFSNSGNRFDLKLQKITDIHLTSHLTGEFEENADSQYITIFAIIGAFILILAAVNFINLSTARSSLRAKEVGIKKAVGSTRKELIQQFLVESVLISLFSFLLAVIIITFGFDYFNSLTGIVFENSVYSNFIILPGLFLIIFLTGIVAGSFPAFVLSRFSPVKVFRNRFTVSSKSNLRNGLVIFQFATSIILIVGTLVVFEQLNYIKNKKLGYDKDQLLVINDAHIAGKGIYALKEKAKTLENVLNCTISSYLPVGEYRRTNGAFPDGNKNDPRILPMQSWFVDYDYISTLGLEIIKGRNFNKKIASDSNAIIINRACLEHFGFENPLEHYLSQGNKDGKLDHFNIIGVVENFHFSSLKEIIQPLIMRIGDNRGYITFRIKGNIEETIGNLKSLWKSVAPDKPFNYYFMDESFNNLYFAEMKIGKLFGIFAALAIFIASLGLLGLIAFTVERKTKEIGIRKVLGASTSSLINLLLKDFLILVLISFIIAAPVSYYFLEEWLNNYAYRTEIPVFIFLIAGFVSIGIAVATVIYHSFKASSLNPIDTIKYE